MNVEELREYVLQKPAVTEGFPFGEDTLVFKINDEQSKQCNSCNKAASEGIPAEHGTKPMRINTHNPYPWHYRADGKPEQNNKKGSPE